jgi:Fe-S-cluster containining protein
MADFRAETASARQFCNPVTEMEHSRGSFCLNLHGDYLCHHTGACCTAGWNIAIEPLVYAKVAAHFGERFRGQSVVRGDASRSSALKILNVRSDAACVFFEGDRGRLCAVHRELGAETLPSACRHFPRVVLQDPRGTMIALSHFCPTAAALLQSPPAPTIVSAPAGLSLDGTAEGLDARGALPPLLHPGMLTDHAGYAAWERRSIDVFAREELTAGDALATIEGVTRTLIGWRPGDGPFRDSVERAFDRGEVWREGEDLDADERRGAFALASVPAGLKAPETFTGLRDAWPNLSRTMAPFDRTVNAYLAARLFGNWMAYHGTGLLAIVEYLRICLSVLRIEAARHVACCSVSNLRPWQTVIEPAIRSADLLLVHLSDTKRLARLLA